MTDPTPTNPYSELNFWRFGLLAAVVMAFLPWSLLVHGILRGFGDTKLLVAALLKDYIQTLIATVTLGLLLVIGVVVAIYQLWPTIVAFVTGIF
jgi:zinc transporter ZupT